MPTAFNKLGNCFGSRPQSKANSKQSAPTRQVILDNDDPNIVDIKRDQEVERTEDAKAAWCFYESAFITSSKRPWEARLTTLLPRDSAWRSSQAADASKTGLPLDRFKDMQEDAHWCFPAWGASSKGRSIGPEQGKPIKKSRSSQSLPTKTTASDAAAAPTLRAGATNKPGAPTKTQSAPRPRTSRNTSYDLPPIDSRKVQDINFLWWGEMHTDHSDDGAGCACDDCLDRAGVDEVDPMQVIDCNNAIVDVERPLPSQPVSLAARSTATSAASSRTDLSETETPRKGLGRIFQTISSKTSKSRSPNASSLSLKMRRSDSGYESSRCIRPTLSN